MLCTLGFCSQSGFSLVLSCEQILWGFCLLPSFFVVPAYLSLYETLRPVCPCVSSAATTLRLLIGGGLGWLAVLLRDFRFVSFRFQMVLHYKGLPFKLTPVGPDAKVRQAQQRNFEHVRRVDCVGV